MQHTYCKFLLNILHST